MGTTSETRIIYFVGTNLGHAVTNKIHDIIAEHLDLDWQLQAIDNPSLDEFVRRMRDEDFGGAVITIPHKITIMSHLDRIDGIGQLLGACNNVYKSSDGFLTGTNTDWIGVRDSLLQLAKNAGHDVSEETDVRYGKAGFVIGAGGAARAAVYTLHKILRAAKVYIINRDQVEVKALMKDITEGYRRASLEPPVLIHLQGSSQASYVDNIFYGVGTVPDFEPMTPQEKNAKQILEIVLSKNKGVFLDMCYKPRMTRNLRLARKYDWVIGDGGQVVGWQLKAQWELWAGKDTSNAIPLDQMILKVHEIVEKLP